MQNFKKSQLKKTRAPYELKVHSRVSSYPSRGRKRRDFSTVTHLHIYALDPTGNHWSDPVGVSSLDRADAKQGAGAMEGLSAVVTVNGDGRQTLDREGPRSFAYPRSVSGSTHPGHAFTRGKPDLFQEAGQLSPVFDAGFNALLMHSAINS
jgi:hypothetical protein